MDNVKIPTHVGIIMDGNGRWANLKGKERSFGHKEGSANVERVVEYAFNRGVKSLTLYAFSTENWARPKKEVDELMRLLKIYFTKFIKKIANNGIRLKVIGDVSVLTPELKKVIEKGEAKTQNNLEHTLNIAINYGGRQEIVHAVNELLKDGKQITIESISKALYTADCGEPDLIIRTGGEFRLSNFLLYQGAYSELYFTDVLWPDFNGEQLEKAFAEYGARNRRFGKI
ncbi:MAG: di-trans,poly-cis-decaprenylcistransferase [Clostridia bacterium]|nr:di-trans,poly-cis-decaprenylcistransferase [Clostridia bacterium]